MYYRARMRVIAGTFRSRLLQAPRGLMTRPTSDRLRETLFNVIGPRVVSARVADLYAGSGAVGIEAVSRGASYVYFAEKASGALASLRGNLRSLGITTGVEVEPNGTAALLRRLEASKPVTALVPAPALLDVVFLDPPYDAADEYRGALTILGMGALLHAGSLVIAEHARRSPLADTYGGLLRTRTLLQGDAALSFYTHTNDLKSSRTQVAG